MPAEKLDEADALHGQYGKSESLSSPLIWLPNKKSTIDGLLAFVSEIYQSMSDRKNINGFFDLTYAFGLVNREISFGKLETFGIGGKVLNWIKSSLRNREQFVEFPGRFYFSTSFAYSICIVLI